MAKAGVISIDLDAGTAKFLVDMDKSNAKLQQFGKGAQDASAHTVSSMQASSAAIRLLENPLGNNIRAIERLISLSPALSKMAQSAFLFVGAGAAVSLLVRMGDEAIKFYQKIEQAPARMATAFRGINDPLTLTNDELTLANDRLANQIAKLSGKPENGLAVALDEARGFADKLTDSLDKDLDRIKKVMAEQGGSSWNPVNWLKPGTSRADKGAAQLQSQVNADRGAPATQSQDIQAELKKVQADLLKALDANAPHAQSGINEGGTPGGGAADAVARLKEYESAYQAKINRIAAEQKQADQTAQAEKLQVAKQNGDKATQELRKSDEEKLAQLQASHQLSVGEVTKYWQGRLKVESSNVDRLRDITITLGHLYQEQDKLVGEVARRGAAEMESQAKKAEEWKSKLEALAVDAEESAERVNAAQAEAQAKSRERTMKIADVGATGTANATEAGIQGNKLQLEREYELQAYHTQSQQIAFMQRIAELDAQSRAAKEAKLQADLDAAKAEGDILKIKEAEVALDKQIAEDKNAGYADQTKIQQTQKRGSLIGSIDQAGASIPGALGGAIAQGAFGGKGDSIGKELTNAMKNVGMHLLGDVVKQMIEKMIATTIGQFALNMLNNWMIHYASNPLGLFAGGGNPDPTKPFIAGEKGPELIHPMGNRLTVVPNRAIGGAAIFPSTRDYMQVSGGAYGGGGSTTVGGGNHTFHIYEANDARDTARQVRNYLRSAIPSGAPYSS